MIAMTEAPRRYRPFEMAANCTVHKNAPAMATDMCDHGVAWTSAEMDAQQQRPRDVVMRIAS